MSNSATKLFQTFVMPILVLTVRIEIDIIFQCTYPGFFNDIGPSGKPNQHVGGNQATYVLRAKRLMNGLITELLDPNLYFSRFSFLESDKDALDIKEFLNMGKKVGFQNFKLPNLQNKYYTRSTNIQNTYQSPSEGKIRAKYTNNLKQHKAALKDRMDMMKLKSERFILQRQVDDNF